MLAHRAVLITVSRLENGQLQVNICPRRLSGGENSALTIPLCVTGTAAELDAELIGQVSGFVTSHVGLNTNLAALEKEIAEADKAAREEAANKRKTAGEARKNVETATPTPGSASEPEPPQARSLFDPQPGAPHCGGITSGA